MLLFYDALTGGEKGTIYAYIKNNFIKIQKAT